VLGILLAMVVTGAARTVAVKSFYQLGFDDPMLVTLFYLLGQSLALLVHFMPIGNSRGSERSDTSHNEIELKPDSSRRSEERRRSSEKAPKIASATSSERGDNSHNEIVLKRDSKGTSESRRSIENQTTIESATESDNNDGILEQEHNEDAEEDAEILDWEAAKLERAFGQISDSYLDPLEWATEKSSGKRKLSLSFGEATPVSYSCEDEYEGIEENSRNAEERPPCRKRQRTRPTQPSLGSLHGLNSESQLAIQWVHKIPFWWKPFIPGVFNLCNSAMRWASLIYVPASIAEMLISGLELVLSVVASRVIRKRLVSKRRWIGVGIVTLGILVVGIVDILREGEDDEKEESTTSGSRLVEQWIGILLIVGQCIMYVLQDLSEELFMQEAHFPPMLLLGMEGLFGLVIGSTLYFPLAYKSVIVLSSSEEESFVQVVEEDWSVAVAVVGLVLLFWITGGFNIWATAVTSSMTRNVWKNFRTILVWFLGLILFYSSDNNEDLGEEWWIPQSFVVLLGFAIMIYGAHLYYNERKQPVENNTDTTNRVVV
jgi:drug/metabolite transporter (DMT)-like permease